MTLKTRKLAEGRYAIVGTRLIVQRGDPPRYREQQEWFLMLDDDDNTVLLIAFGKAQAVDRVEMILAAMKG